MSSQLHDLGDRNSERSRALVTSAVHGRGVRKPIGRYQYMGEKILKSRHKFGLISQLWEESSMWICSYREPNLFIIFSSLSWQPPIRPPIQCFTYYHVCKLCCFKIMFTSIQRDYLQLYERLEIRSFLFPRSYALLPVPLLQILTSHTVHFSPFLLPFL